MNMLMLLLDSSSSSIMEHPSSSGDPLPERRSAAVAEVPPEQSFPVKLQAMLADAYPRGFDSIIRWMDDQHFKVFDIQRFQSEVLPRYFHSTKHKSFTRQLNLYDFERITEQESPFRGCYRHPMFRRDKPQWAADMTRTRKPATAKRKDDDSQGADRKQQRSSASSSSLPDYGQQQLMAQQQQQQPSSHAAASAAAAAIGLGSSSLLGNPSVMHLPFPSPTGPLIPPPAADQSFFPSIHRPASLTDNDDNNNPPPSQERLVGFSTEWADRLPEDIREEIIRTFKRPRES